MTRKPNLGVPLGLVLPVVAVLMPHVVAAASAPKASSHAPTVSLTSPGSGVSLIAPATITLTAVATDNSGASTTSAAVTITVKPNAPPSVSLTSPANASSFTDPVTIALTADGADSDGSVRVVRFFAGAKRIGTAVQAPYTVMWRHATVGTHRLTAVATDNLGAHTTSAAVTVTVKPNVPPTVHLTSPADGGAFTAGVTVAISADASDTEGGTVKLVTFLVDSQPIGVARHAPYTVTWRHISLGTHTLSAVATDNGGASTLSASVRIRVVEDTPPTVSLTSPANGSTFDAPATITVSADAADQIASSRGGVGSVTFYAAAAGGSPTAILTNYSAPYTFEWSATAGVYSLTAVATDTAGQQTTSAAISITVNAHDPTPQTEPLVQPADLVYEGAFRVPDGMFPGPNVNDWARQHGWATFDYGGLAVGINPANNSLFMVGNNQGALVAEITIPTLLPGSDLSSLNIASLVQPFADPTEGLIDTINPGSDNSKKIGGLFPYQDRLYLSAYDYYDGLGSQVVSHFVSGLDLGVVGDVSGPYAVGNPSVEDPTRPALGAGFTDGYFGMVPDVWQAALGGPVLNGNCCLGVISRTSFGPALFAIDPTQLGVTSPLPAKPLVYYPCSVTGTDSCHPLARHDSTGPYFNGTSEVRGVVFPKGWRSVLFFGRHGGLGGATDVPGLGEYCYGPGTDQPALVGTPAPPEGVDNYCYDPDDDSKGVHGYPYHYYVWAYDANDLVAVASGQTQPWAIKPYAVWPLNLPFATAGSMHLSAGYDPQGGRIYLSQYQGDGLLPLIYVVKLQTP